MKNDIKPGKGYETLSKLVDDFCESITSVPDEQLNELVELPKTLTRTNCGWTNYSLSSFVAEIAEDELKLREIVGERLKGDGDD